MAHKNSAIKIQPSKDSDRESVDPGITTQEIQDFF
jgi:hypothetical protein